MDIYDEFSVCQAKNSKTFQIDNLANAYGEHYCEIDLSNTRFYELFGTVVDFEKPTLIDLCGLPHANVSLVCLKICLNVINYGKDVLYVDTKNGMTPNLIRAFYDETKINYENIQMSNVSSQFYYKFLLDENDFEKFFNESVLKSILKKYKNLRLIVIDGICNPLRCLNAQERALKVQTFLNIMNKFLVVNKLLVLITSNYVIDIADNTLLPVPGDSYSHRVHHRFLFDKDQDKFVLFK